MKFLSAYQDNSYALLRIVTGFSLDFLHLFVVARWPSPIGWLMRVSQFTRSPMAAKSLHCFASYFSIWVHKEQEYGRFNTF